MRVGILALQGDFERHHHLLHLIGLKSLSVRYPNQLDKVEGLIIPGGESSTITKLMNRIGFIDPLKSFSETFPILGTCAGMILMAEKVPDPRIKPLGILDITVERNAFGRQIHSFTDDLHIKYGDTQTKIPATFIRAPKVRKVGKKVEIMANYDNSPVAVREGRHIGLSFHPELDGITLFHEILFTPSLINSSGNHVPVKSN